MMVLQFSHQLGSEDHYAEASYYLRLFHSLYVQQTAVVDYLDPIQIFREILDLPLHQPECGSGLYPPQLLLTVRALDESQPPTTDLMCDLEVRGTKRPCCLKLEMKHPSLESPTQGKENA